MEFRSMRDLVIAVGGPLLPGENRKGWLGRVAKWAGISPRVASAAFYGETSSRGAAAKLKAAAGRYEAENLARQFEHLAMSLNVRDADFHSPDVSALLDAARALRGLDRTRTHSNEKLTE
jgi:hypothetical protein